MDTPLPTPPTPLAACFRYWGKARPAIGEATPFHLLPYHCLDVAAVGVEALKCLPALRSLLSGRLGLAGELLDRWMGFWLAVHDLGKFSEAFQSQRPDVFQHLRGRLPAKPYTLRREHPGESALLGLLAAALGLRRDDEAAHAALRDGCAFAVGVVSGGSLLRDYHTAQVPGRSAMKGRPHATRRDELAVPKETLNTILSTRDYRQDVAYVIAVQPRKAATTPLDALAAALHRPRFVLYLGRKSCPPAAPLDPLVLDAPSVREAIGAYLGRRGEAVRLVRMAWGDGIDVPGELAHLSAPRKDRMIRRRGWQFGDRTEHVALLTEGE